MSFKHFKWEARGKKRIHSTPNQREIRACRPWLDAEIGQIRPRVVVALGATAARALLGNDFRVSTQHGEFVDSDLADFVMATVHPSSILRARDADSRELQLESFRQDLMRISELVAAPAT